MGWGEVHMVRVQVRVQVGGGGLSHAAAVHMQCACTAVHMPRLHRAAAVVLAVEQHRRSCCSAGLEGEEASTCTCSVEAVYTQPPLYKARKPVQAAATNGKRHHPCLGPGLAVPPQPPRIWVARALLLSA